METTTRTIPTNGPFSLAESAALGFGRRAEPRYDGVLRLAFTVDGDHERTAGVAIRQAGDALDLELTTDGDPDVVAAQVARILSVDVDGTGFARLAERDPLVGALVAAAPGLRPPQFHNPYEAAAWSVMYGRRSHAQTLSVRERLAAAYGVAHEVAGRTVHAFPTPSALSRLPAFPGLQQVMVPRLHAVAAAARDGLLDIGRLTAMDPEVARADLQRLPGIGAFYSALVVARACGNSDVLPLNEPRSRAMLARLAGLDEPPADDEFVALAEGWRPYRMWVLFLARAAGSRIPVAA